MSNITTESTYSSDLDAAVILIQQFVNFDEADGNARNWACDALNNEWRDGVTVEQWVAQALIRMNHGQ